MPINKEEMQKLSPEARMKKLKEIEQEKKKEIEEAGDLIKRAQAEIDWEKSIPKIRVPELKPIDITRLFEEQQGLEAAVKLEAPKEEVAGIKYVPAEEAPVREYSGWGTEKPDDAASQKRPQTKYNPIIEQVDDLTGSKSVLKNIKKYRSD